MDSGSGKVIWFTGLSGSGKSTLSDQLRQILEQRCLQVSVLDGDQLRQGLNRDLGFSAEDRVENLRRAAELAKILADAGRTVIAAFITPLESIRTAIRMRFAPHEYTEVFLSCPLSDCESRDPKGLYKKARAGEIPEFTGLTSPFETPAGADLDIPTQELSVTESVRMLLDYLERKYPDLRKPVRRSASHAEKVAVIGLDGAPPELVFDEYRHLMPNISRLMKHGVWGSLRSTDPPITIPAWAAMTTGRDPGELGLYGFRNRCDYGYGLKVTADSSYVRAKRVWDYLEDHGRRSTLVGIPQTYPAIPHYGVTVSDFPDGPDAPAAVYPSHCRDLLGEDYLADIRNFRGVPKEELRSKILGMTRSRFRAAAEILAGEPWDFFMMVEIGLDRMHHGFWRFSRSDHRLYEPGNPYEQTLPDYYRMLDALVGTLPALMDDSTTLFIVSDHGTGGMEGGICINDLLIRWGYLVLHGEPEGPKDLTPDMVDWSRTTAWSEGGYYARVFVNVKGREPQGTVSPSEYPEILERLTKDIEGIADESGRTLMSAVLRPPAIYRQVNGIPPDLLVYFDGLRRRSIGTVGNRSVHVYENNTGPDDANHLPDGICIRTRLSDLRRGVVRDERVFGMSITDITPSILSEFGLPVPSELSGIPIAGEGGAVQARVPDSLPEQARQGFDDEGFTPEEEEIVRKRLTDLGYI